MSIATNIKNQGDRYVVWENENLSRREPLYSNPAHHEPETRRPRPKETEIKVVEEIKPLQQNIIVPENDSMPVAAEIEGIKVVEKCRAEEKCAATGERNA